MALNAYRERIARPSADPGANAAPYPDPTARPVTDALQRVIDVIGSAVLLVLVSPMLLGAALVVRITSRGPAFFWQDRYGRDEALFRVVKLRTMVVDQAKVIDLVRVEELERVGVLSKSENDPRVTAVGKFLRRSSIDELPQLWNILRGDMSLVGPRPVPRFMLDIYPDLRRVRCAVRPGLTGLWQVNQRSANTSAMQMADEDLEYIATRSTVGDLRIILRTVPAVIKGSGAI